MRRDKLDLALNDAKKNMTKGVSKHIRNNVRDMLTMDFASDFAGLDYEKKVKSREIELDKIRTRAVNQFHISDQDLELEESIKMWGLVNPIAVHHKVGEDVYTISAGERRYRAVKRLHELYPDNELFQTIECRVYIITDDPKLLETGFPYISAEQEEGIYRDTNLQARQLSESDIASQMRDIVDRFYDDEYMANVRKSAEKLGIRTYSNPDRVVLIQSVLKSQNLWSSTKIRQYLAIYDAKREDLLENVEDGTMTVNAAYIVLKENQKKRQRVTNPTKKFVKSIDMIEWYGSERSYSEADISNLEQCIDRLNAIVARYRESQ